MKQKRSMDEALTAAKKLRENLNTTQPPIQPESDSHLNVVNSKIPKTKTLPEDKPTAPIASANLSVSAKEEEPKALFVNPKPIWVRHTIGLRDATSLSLRDAADGQKRKERHGQLRMGEPTNEQEIADLGISLALKELGYLAHS